MKILLVIPTLRHGGAERVMSELANEWVSEGHEVHLALLINEDRFYSLSEKVSVHILGFGGKGAISKMLSRISVIYKLRRLITKLKPGATLSFMAPYNIATLLAGFILPARIFISDRASPLVKYGAFERILRRFLYPRATGIISQTEFAKNVMRKEIRHRNIAVIPNPVKVIEALPIKRENIVLCVGRFIPGKGQELLLRAFKEVDRSGWKLALLGDGPTRPQLEKIVRELDLEEKVLMPGAIKNIDEWLGRASVFAFPSTSEGFPNALAEAMAAGLPCVSFNCNAGPSDLIRNGENGFLVEIKDYKLFVDRLAQLMSDQDIRRRFSSRAVKIRDELEGKAIARRFMTFMTATQE